MTLPAFSYRKIGGLHFVRLGRFTFMACRRRPRATTRIVLHPAAPFRLSTDGVLVLGYADETN